MKKVVLIDGENFIHLLLHVMKAKNPAISREQLVDFPVRKLLESVIDLQKTDDVYYFGTKLKLGNAPAALRPKIEKTRAFQAKWTNNLAKQGIKFIKSGYLRVRETVPCSKCGNQEIILLEKGVDVALAVKAIEEANKTTEIIFITSDTDLLPAFRSAKQRDATVTYLGFEENIIIALAATASRTRSFARESILSLGEEK